MAVCARYTDNMKEKVPSNDSGGQQRHHREESVNQVLQDDKDSLGRANQKRPEHKGPFGTGNTARAEAEGITQSRKAGLEVTGQLGPDCERPEH